MNPLHAVRKPPAAFTLVEVTLALGVIAFGVLAIFGLLVVSIDSGRFSREDTALAAMVRTVTSDLRGREFFEIEDSFSGAGTIVYLFDVDGRLLERSLGAAAVIPMEAIYESRVSAPAPRPAGFPPGKNLLPVDIVFSWPATAPLANRETRRLPSSIPRLRLHEKVTPN